MFAAASKVDVTPSRSVFMEGMIRAGKSKGVHDRLYARTLVLANDTAAENLHVVVSVDVCVLGRESIADTRRQLAQRWRIAPGNVTISTTHTHSGPSTRGYFQPVETAYVEFLTGKIVESVENSLDRMQPALVACGHGREATISKYRRFHDPKGKVVMMWEQDPTKNPLKVLGVPDEEVGVLKLVSAKDPSNVLCVLFNHAGHPNVMSGDNLFISADYTGVAERKVEERYNGIGMFINGSQGSVDIDNWNYRDWEAMETLGGKLAAAVIEAADGASVRDGERLHGGNVEYTLPARTITESEAAWAKKILKTTGGKVAPLADGVGDDYKALLYDRLARAGQSEVPFEQTCFAIGDTAFLSVECELFTEIGRTIKRESPFAHTYILGLSNGCLGYVPTAEAIRQGGYEVDTRSVDENAADLIVSNSLALLRRVHAMGR